MNSRRRPSPRRSDGNNVSQAAEGNEAHGKAAREGGAPRAKETCRPHAAGRVWQRDPDYGQRVLDRAGGRRVLGNQFTRLRALDRRYFSLSYFSPNFSPNRVVRGGAAAGMSRR